MPTLSGPVLQCQSCNEKFPLNTLVWRCHCGGLIDVKETAIFPKEQLAQRPMNFWRFRESLALPDDALHISLGEVMTPLLKKRFRNWEVSFKLEYMSPTGSYKDRGIAVSLSHLSGLGVSTVAEDSSGIHADIYVPTGTSPAKVGQIRVYGAECQLVPGTRIESAQEAQTARDGVYYVGHSWSPLFACGIKSVAYEIAEQNNWCLPDWIVTPVGGGSLVMGLIDGFTELLSAGYVQRLPRILAVQSAACAPIYQAWLRSDPEISAVEPHPTCAEGVALPNPPRGTQVLQAIRRYNGTMLAVDDAEVMSCWRDMAQMGIFMEPTSAIAVAGAWLGRNDGDLILPEETVVVLVTGHGLKTKTTLMPPT